MCAIFGMLDYGKTFSGKERYLILKVLSQACEIRGTDATGYAFFQDEKLVIQKAPKPASKMKFYVPDHAGFIMGHTRMTTQGSETRNCNNHPFEGNTNHHRFALAHNGVLHNDAQLRKAYALPKTSIETDSYVAVQLLEQEKSICFSSLKRMAENLEGSFTMTVLTQECIYFVRGSNPLCIYHIPDLKCYVYASTEDILKSALTMLGVFQHSYEQVNVQQGEILRVDTLGNLETAYFDVSNLLNSYYPRRWGSYFTNFIPEVEDEHLAVACQFARNMGISEEELDLMIDAGYDALDIEEMIYDPELRYEALAEIYYC